MYYKTYWNKNKTPFLILHWWGGSITSWENVANMLSKDFFVIVPEIPLAAKQDNRIKTGLKAGVQKNIKKSSEEKKEFRQILAQNGDGFKKWIETDFKEAKLESEKEVYTLDDYAVLIKEFIDKLKLENFILLGHSNGWAIATKLVVNFPKLKVKKLILNNSAWIRKDRKRSLKRKIFWVIAKIVKPIFSLPWMWKLRNLFYRAIWWQDYLEAEKYPWKKQTYLNMINEDLQDIFPKINLDTLLIWWENDTYTPLSDWKKINNLIKNSKLVIIKNVRHGIHLQKPKKLLEVILDNN